MQALMSWFLLSVCSIVLFLSPNDCVNCFQKVESVFTKDQVDCDKPMIVIIPSGNKKVFSRIAPGIDKLNPIYWYSPTTYSLYLDETIPISTQIGYIELDKLLTLSK